MGLGWDCKGWGNGEHPVRAGTGVEVDVLYCWLALVKHGFVARAVDWTYSSTHRVMRAGRVEVE